jgi:hypothetical protein
MNSELNDRAAESSGIVAAAGLVYVSDAMAGIRRVRTAHGFVYTLPNDRRLTPKPKLWTASGTSASPEPNVRNGVGAQRALELRTLPHRRVLHRGATYLKNA